MVGDFLFQRYPVTNLLEVLKELEKEMIQSRGVGKFEHLGVGPFLTFLIRNKEIVHACCALGGSPTPPIQDLLRFLRQCGPNVPDELVEKRLGLHYGTGIRFGSVMQRLRDLALQDAVPSSSAGTHLEVYYLGALNDCMPSVSVRAGDHVAMEKKSGQHQRKKPQRRQKKKFSDEENDDANDDDDDGHEDDDDDDDDDDDCSNDSLDHFEFDKIERDKPHAKKTTTVLGLVRKRDAEQCLMNAPYLVPLGKWCCWDQLFKAKFGEFQGFVSNNQQLKFSILELKPGKWIKIDRGASAEKYKEAIGTLDAYSAAVQLVSISVLYNGAVSAPLSLLSTYTRTIFMTTQGNEHFSSSERLANFVLLCLMQMPISIRQYLAGQVRPHLTFLW